jgi:hypothetical protein
MFVYALTSWAYVPCRCALGKDSVSRAFDGTELLYSHFATESVLVALQDQQQQ